jgi:hypothetical protein
MNNKAPWEVPPLRPWEMPGKDGKTVLAPGPGVDESPHNLAHAILPALGSSVLPALLAPETMGGSMALSGVGAGLGQAANEGIDRLTGANKKSLFDVSGGEDAAKHIGEQAVLAALSVPVGKYALGPAAKLIGKTPVPFTGENLGGLTAQAIEKLIAGTKGLASSTTSFFTGVPRAATDRMMAMPDAVMNPAEASLNSDSAYQQLAQKARDKFVQTGKDRTDAVAAAKKLIDPTKTADTKAMINDLLSMASEKNPLPSGHGPLSPAGVAELKTIANRDLTSPKFTFDAPHPDALSSAPLEETVQVSPEVRASKIDIAEDPEAYAKGTKSLTVTPGDEYTVAPAQNKTVRYGYENQVPVQNKKNLMKLYDWASNQIDAGAYNENPAARSSSLSDGILKQLKGKLSKAVANEEPPLQAANKAYSQWADDADLLKQAGEEEKVQAFLKRISGEGKTPEQEAAKRIFPDELQKQQGMMESDAAETARAKADKSASDAFNPYYAGTGKPMVRGAMGAGLGLLGGEELYHGRPDYGLPALAAAALLNPGVAKQGLYQFAKRGIPAIERTIADSPNAAAFLGGYKANPWSLLKRKDDSQ